MKMLLIRSGEEITRELVIEIFTMLDKDNSGEVDFNEFFDSLESNE